MNSFKTTSLHSNLTQNQTSNHKSLSDNISMVEQINQATIRSKLTKPSLQKYNKIQLQSNIQLHPITKNNENDDITNNLAVIKKVDQFLFSFIISLLIPMINSTLMASAMFQLQDKFTINKLQICLSLSIFMFIYFILETIVRFGIIKCTKYYFHLDRLLLGSITSSLAYYVMTKQANLWSYYTVSPFIVAFWLFTMAGNLRVSLKQYNWSRWHMFFSKLAYCYSGSIILYSAINFTYMGVYTIFPKKLVPLFVFGVFSTLYEHYKLVLNFDETGQLMLSITFKSVQSKMVVIEQTEQDKNKLIANLKQVEA